MRESGLGGHHQCRSRQSARLSDPCGAWWRPARHERERRPIIPPPRDTSANHKCGDYVSAENRETKPNVLYIGQGFEGNADMVGAVSGLNNGRQSPG